MTQKKNIYKSPPVGHTIRCVFKVRDISLINNKDNHLKSLLESALIEDNFTILGWLDHQFSPQGYSCLALLAESHAGFHTYPEHGTVEFEMYSCRGPHDAANTLDYIKRELHLKPKDMIFFKEDQVPLTNRAKFNLKID
jgi:S-adenosylmethionine/arginine decarboxylase-like enzyme